MDLNLTEVGNQTVTLWNRSQTRLRRLWEQGPLVLVLLRHYG